MSTKQYVRKRRVDIWESNGIIKVRKTVNGKTKNFSMSRKRLEGVLNKIKSVLTTTPENLSTLLKKVGWSHGGGDSDILPKYLAKQPDVEVVKAEGKILYRKK